MEIQELRWRPLSRDFVAVSKEYMRVPQDVPLAGVCAMETTVHVAIAGDGGGLYPFHVTCSSPGPLHGGDGWCPR